ncbi:hypothetical protein [Dongshaea marina]|uniref:hypothetical protein n=1 Tax=Dongshaea marina TaxID=2047966 RepID=UPI000D3E6A5E|nr:hypothetical protein [Dongshaea marina]
MWRLFHFISLHLQLAAVVMSGVLLFALLGVTALPVWIADLGRPAVVMALLAYLVITLGPGILLRLFDLLERLAVRLASKGATPQVSSAPKTLSHKEQQDLTYILQRQLFSSARRRSSALGSKSLNMTSKNRQRS